VERQPHVKERFGERQLDSRFQVQLEADECGSTGQSWMEWSGLWPMFHSRQQDVSQVSSTRHGRNTTNLSSHCGCRTWCRSLVWFASTAFSSEQTWLRRFSMSCCCVKSQIYLPDSLSPSYGRQTQSGDLCRTSGAKSYGERELNPEFHRKLTVMHAPSWFADFRLSAATPRGENLN